MNLFSADLDSVSFEGVEDFLAIKAPIEQRPPEGLRIDYKLKEPADLSDTVAAFANSFGGCCLLASRVEGPSTISRYLCRAKPSSAAISKPGSREKFSLR